MSIMINKHGVYRKAGSINTCASKRKEVQHLAIAFKLMLITAVLTLFALLLGLKWLAVIVSFVLSITVLVYVHQYLDIKHKSLGKISILALPLTVILAAYYFWKIGSPYGGREYDDSGQYYIQRYSTIGPSMFKTAMPGQGSDNIDGLLVVIISICELLACQNPVKNSRTNLICLISQ